MLDELDSQTLSNGDTFHDFVRACKALKMDMEPAHGDAAIWFIPTDSALRVILKDAMLQPCLLYDIVRICQIDMRDLRDERVALDNLKPDVASVHPEYGALWKLIFDRNRRKWHLDNLEVHDERIVIRLGQKVWFVWGVNGILSTPEVTARLRSQAACCGKAF